MKKSLQLTLSIILLLGVASCGSRKSAVLFEAQSPAKRLFDYGTRAFATQHYAEAITLFETSINAYPDSPYSERARLALVDCDRVNACASVHAMARAWGAGGGQTFFPNMPAGKARHGYKPTPHH